MNATAAPKARFGWEGQTVEYVVHVDGAREVSAPAKAEKGLQVRVLDTRQVNGGVEARVAVDVASGALY